MKRLLIPLLAAMMLYAVACFVRYYTLPLEVQAQTNTFCAANLACTVSASWTFGTMNGVLYVGGGNPSNFAGADIGAQINSAYAACGTQGCTIRILQQASGTACYAFTTPITFTTAGKYIRLEGDVSSSSGSDQGACLNYTPTTGTAISLNFAQGTQRTGQGVYRLFLKNGTCATIGGCGNTSVGIALTGSPGETFAEIADSTIVGFGTGILKNNTIGAFGEKFRDLVMTDNNTAFSSTTSAENLFFERGLYNFNGTAFNFGATAAGFSDIKLKDLSCDDNTVNCLVVGNQSGASSFVLDNVHFENVNLGTQHYINIGTGVSLKMVGGSMNDDLVASAGDFMLTTGGTMLEAFGTGIRSNRTETAVVQANSPVRVYAAWDVQTSNTIPTIYTGTSTAISDFSLNGFNAGGPRNWPFNEASLMFPTAPGLPVTAAGNCVSAQTQPRLNFVKDTNNCMQAFSDANGASQWSGVSGGGSSTNMLAIHPSLGLVIQKQITGSGGNIFYSVTAPTIAAAGCGGAAASIVVSNGTAAFKVNVGTTPTSACTLTFPAATTGWNVTCNDITTQSTAVFVQKQTGVESTTSVTITNFNDVAAATAFVASDILKCTASAD